MNRTADPQHVFSDNPLSSAAMRLALFPKASHGGLGPRRSRPFGLWHTASYPLPERPAVNYCHRQQVIVDDAGRSLVAQLDNAKPPPDPPTPPPKPKEWESDAARIYAHREARLGLGGVLSELDTRWVNHPNRSADSSYKPVQLATAARYGLTTAVTVITNDPEAVRRLAWDCPGGIVQKSLGPNTITEGDRIEVAFTRRLEPADLEDLSAVELTATQVQAWVEKKYEARVIVVGDQMFTILIYAGSPAGHVDWRADYKSLNYEWIETPSEIAKPLRGYVDRLGLAYAAVDFAIDHDDRWVFLESNSAGQYYWLEAHTGAPITSALCDLLSGVE
ncbi:MAG: hypothetical protein ACRDSZ_02735 [Pseudonocardiaceae bacterium]